MFTALISYPYVLLVITPLLEGGELCLIRLPFSLLGRRGWDVACFPQGGRRLKYKPDKRPT